MVSDLLIQFQRFAGGFRSETELDLMVLHPHLNPLNTSIPLPGNLQLKLCFIWSLVLCKTYLSSSHSFWCSWCRRWKTSTAGFLDVSSSDKVWISTWPDQHLVEEKEACLCWIQQMSDKHVEILTHWTFGQGYFIFTISFHVFALVLTKTHQLL